MRAGLWLGMVTPVSLGMFVEWIWWWLRVNPLFLCILLACVLCFLRLLLRLCSHIQIWAHWNDDIFVWPYPSVWSSIFAAVLSGTVYHCLEKSSLMINSYTLEKYSDFNVCFISLFLCLQIAAYCATSLLDSIKFLVMLCFVPYQFLLLVTHHFSPKYFC